MNQFGKNINLTIQPTEQPQDKNMEEVIKKQERMYAHQLQTLATSFNVHVHRLNTSISNLIGKTELLAGTPEIHKVARSFRQFTTPAYKGVIEQGLAPYIPLIQQKIPIYEAATDIINRFKSLPKEKAEKIFGEDIVYPEKGTMWATTLTRKHIEKVLQSEEAKKTLENAIGRKVSPEILEEMAVMFGEGSKVSTARDMFDKTARALRKFNAKIELATESFGKLQKNLEEASKVPFAAQFKYGFTQPFKKLTNTLGIPTGMGWGTAIGGFLGTASTAALLGGIYLAGRTVKQGFSRYTETAPTKTDLILRNILAGGAGNITTRLNRYSADMALWGIREPQALEYINKLIGATPAFSGSPNKVYEDAINALTKNVAQFRLLGVKAEDTTKFLTTLQSIGVNVARFDQTKFGKDIISLVTDTRLIGYKQVEYLKSFTDTIESNKLTYFSAKDLEGFQKLSRRLVETGIPVLQGQAPQVANLLYKSISNFGGQFAPLIWASAPGKSLWERYKNIQSPFYTPDIISNFAKLLGVGKSEYGNILFTSFLKSSGLPGNLAVSITELLTKKATKGLTEAEEKQLQTKLRQAYEQTPEGRLNKLVAVSESILRTLEGTIAGNVVKMASVLATKFGYSQNAEMKKYVAKEMIANYTEIEKATKEQAELEGWDKKKTERELKKKKEQLERAYGISLPEAETLVFQGWVKSQKEKIKESTTFKTIKRLKDWDRLHESIDRWVGWGKPNEFIDTTITKDINKYNAWIKGQRKPSATIISESIADSFTKALAGRKLETKQTPLSIYESPSLLSSYQLQKYIMDTITAAEQKHALDRALITKLEEYKNRANSTTNIDILQKIIEELRKLLTPQNNNLRSNNTINVTVHIDGVRANNTRTASTNNIYAELSDAFITALKEALSRAGVYDLTPILGIAPNVAQG